MDCLPMTDPTAPDREPSWRQPAGALAIIGIILLWCLLVIVALPFVGRWPIILQLPVYVLAGIAWIFPLKPLLRWMETGAWR